MLAIPKFKDHELVRADNSRRIIMPTENQTSLSNYFITKDWEHNRL